jgi:dTDP-4-dehydrorhamnose reductase
VRILITGASGLVGGRLCELLAGHHDVAALVRNGAAPEGVPEFKADLSAEAATDRIIASVRPDFVIHCAALADAEICERDPARAHSDNVVAAGNVARAARTAGARLLFFSTDLVFGGDRAWSTEEADPAPLSAYGRTKLEGEQATLSEHPEAVVFRISIVCGRGIGARMSASEALAVRMRGGETATLYEDEWRTPTDPESIGNAVEAVIERPAAAGIFHIAGRERFSRIELGERVASLLHLDAGLLRSAVRAQHRGAPRPSDVSLDISRATRELGWEPRSLDDAVRESRIA